jgi:hypothetical protein
MRAFYLVPLRTDAWGSDHPDAVIAIDRFPCVVGRHPDCDRRLHNPVVSRRHCAFWLRDGRAWVKDLGSRNGTGLNGKPPTGAAPWPRATASTWPACLSSVCPASRTRRARFSAWPGSDGPAFPEHPCRPTRTPACPPPRR